MFESLTQNLFEVFLVGFVFAGGILLAFAIYKNWGAFLALVLLIFAFIANGVLFIIFGLYHLVRRAIWPWTYGLRGEVLPKGHIRTNLGVIDTSRAYNYQVAKHQNDLKAWALDDWPGVHQRLGDTVTIYYLTPVGRQIQNKFVLKPDLDEFIRSRGKKELNSFTAPYHYIKP